MLRCPKCNYICNDDTQIFCTNEGAKLLSLNQAVGQMPNKKPSRRTPPGELLFEVFMSPPNPASVKKAFPANGKPSFQMFGLRSSSVLDAAPEAENTNGFHSFESLIVDNQESGIEEKKSASNSSETFEKTFSDESEPEETRRFGMSLFWYCLLGALLFLAGIAFAANYFL